MKWEFVFNSTLNQQFWGDRYDCLAFVKQTGYRFFTWNGDIYDLTDEKTGITITDLF